MHTDKDKQLESSPSEGSSRAQSQQKTPGQALTRCSCKEHQYSKVIYLLYVIERHAVTETKRLGNRKAY